METKLKVYKAGKKYDGYLDQYSLYYPIPRKKVKESGYKGVILGFSFGEHYITKCTHDEFPAGFDIQACLGKKVDIKTLPEHVQEWIAKEEKEWQETI